MVNTDTTVGLHPRSQRTQGVRSGYRSTSSSAPSGSPSSIWEGPSYCSPTSGSPSSTHEGRSCRLCAVVGFSASAASVPPSAARASAAAAVPVSGCSAARASVPAIPVARCSAVRVSAPPSAARAAPSGSSTWEGPSCSPNSGSPSSTHDGLYCRLCAVVGFSASAAAAPPSAARAAALPSAAAFSLASAS